MRVDASRRLASVDPCDPDFYNNPYPIYHQLRASVPIFKWEEYGHWCFARHADVNALLRDPRFGRQILHVATREELGLPGVPEHLKSFYAFERHSLLELEPPIHTRLRSLVSKSFLPRQVEILREDIARLCGKLIDPFEHQAEIDVMASYATPIPIAIICKLLGVPVDVSKQLLSWSHDMVCVYQARRDRALEDAAEKATVEFSNFMRSYIAERRKNRGQDLLSELIQAEEQGQRLSEDELVTTAILLLNAGHEASVHTIGNAIKALLETGHKSDITSGHIEEALRYDAPLHLFKRYALEDLEYAGIKFRKGEVVGLLLGAANRDPARFPDPDVFNPGRTPNPHVSFGAGIHFCLGSALARLELNIAIPMLFSRLPNLKIIEPPRYRNVFHFHGLERLMVSS